MKRATHTAKQPTDVVYMWYCLRAQHPHGARQSLRASGVHRADAHRKEVSRRPDDQANVTAAEVDLRQDEEAAEGMHRILRAQLIIEDWNQKGARHDCRRDEGEEGEAETDSRHRLAETPVQVRLREEPTSGDGEHESRDDALHLGGVINSS